MAYLTSTSLLGASDSDSFTLSVWIKPDSVSSDQTILYADDGGTLALNLGISSAGSLEIRLYNSSGALTISVLDGTITASTLQHLLISGDSGADELHVYLDDTELSLSVGYANEGNTVWSTVDDFTIFAGSGGGTHYAGNVADLWFDNTYLDLSIESNRRKFIDSLGAPAYLGASGNRPTGTAPLIFFGDDHVAADWTAGTNLGTAGDFTDNGSPYTDV